MTVSELITELKKMPKKAEVFLSSDSEGNAVNRLFCVEESPQNAEGPCHVDDANDSLPSAVVLWP